MPAPSTLTTYATLDSEIVNYVKSIDLTQYAALRLLCGQNAVRRFCRDTGIWQATLSPMTVATSTASYILQLATSDLVYVVWAKYKRTADTNLQYAPLAPGNRDFMEHFYGASWEFQTGTPSTFLVELIETAQATPDLSAETILLYPIPQAADAGQLLVRVAQMPTMTSTSFPNFFYNSHREALIQAYLYEAYSMTNKPWSSTELAVLALARYEDLVYYAQTMARQGKTMMESMPYFPSFGGSRNANWVGGA